MVGFIFFHGYFRIREVCIYKRKKMSGGTIQGIAFHPPPQIIKNRGHQEYYDLDSFYHDHGQSYSGNVGNKEIYLFSRMRGNKISKRRKISLYLIMRKVYLASIQSFLIRKFLLKVIQENMYPPGKKYENKRRKKLSMKRNEKKFYLHRS